MVWIFFQAKDIIERLEGFWLVGFWLEGFRFLVYIISDVEQPETYQPETRNLPTSNLFYLYPMNTPLLLLHGALGSAGQFDKLVPLLPAGWQVYVLNLPGHGGVPLPADFSIAHFSEAVLAFLNKKNISQAQFFGYSMGGYTALQLAAQHPERVQGIVTLGAKLRWTPEIADKEAALLNPDKIATKVPVFAELLAARHAPVDWREVLRRTAGLLHDLGNGAALQPATFRAISCPVLIGLGSDDHMVTVEESREVADLLPNGRFERLQGVKHPLEQVDPVLLAEWLIANLGSDFSSQPSH